MAGIVEVLGRGRGDDDPPGDVLDVLGGRVPVVGEVVLADVGDHRVGVDQVRAFFLDAVFHGGLAQRLDGFGVHDQPGQLFPNMGGLVDAVVLGHQAGGAGEELQLHGLVGLGAEAVEVGEHVGHLAGEFPFPLEEDALVGDEDVIENDGGVVDVDGRRRWGCRRGRRLRGSRAGRRSW